MGKLISLVVLFFASSIFAQAINWTGLADTNNLRNFRKDSLFMGKAMNNTLAENKLLVVIMDDTVNAGRATDSVVAEIGYQLGTPIYTLLGTVDTIWTYSIPIDTFNTLAASKRYNPTTYTGATQWALDASTDLSTRPHGQIDTTVSTTSSGMFIPFTPYWSPLIRFYAKGLTGNGGTFIRGRFTFTQRSFTNVRNK